MSDGIKMTPAVSAVNITQKDPGSTPAGAAFQGYGGVSSPALSSQLPGAGAQITANIVTLPPTVDATALEGVKVTLSFANTTGLLTLDSELGRFMVQLQPPLPQLPVLQTGNQFFLSLLQAVGGASGSLSLPQLVLLPRIAGQSQQTSTESFLDIVDIAPERQGNLQPAPITVLTQPEQPLSNLRLPADTILFREILLHSRNFLAADPTTTTLSQPQLPSDAPLSLIPIIVKGGVTAFPEQLPSQVRWNFHLPFPEAKEPPDMISTLKIEGNTNYLSLSSALPLDSQNVIESLSFSFPDQMKPGAIILSRLPEMPGLPVKILPHAMGSDIHPSRITEGLLMTHHLRAGEGQALFFARTDTGKAIFLLQPADPFLQKPVDYGPAIAMIMPHTDEKVAVPGTVVTFQALPGDGKQRFDLSLVLSQLNDFWQPLLIAPLASQMAMASPQQTTKAENVKISHFLFMALAGLKLVDQQDLPFTQTQRAALMQLLQVTEDNGNIALFRDQSGQDWQQFSVPFFERRELHMPFFYLALPQQNEYRRDQKNSTDHERRKQQPYRFVIDMALDRMGDVQLEGLMQHDSARPSLDLTLKTELPMDKSVQDRLRSLYHSALSETAIAGDLFFHTDKKRWVYFDQDRARMSPGIWTV